ncbi:MAG: KTSC domain-containing protein [Selenomonadales bacterium]|nr:KTSC domain-containing protein [Selenomonadales bacterium]
MNLISVSSSNVRAIGYEDGVIEVHFRNGYVYQYNANQSLFHAFLSAPSKGKFVHQHLKHLPTRRIR